MTESFRPRPLSPGAAGNPEDELAGCLVTPAETLLHAMERMNANSLGLCLVVDSERKLLGTISDGDIRRAFLHNIPLTSPCGEIITDLRIKGRAPSPVTAPAGSSRQHLLRIMNERNVRQVPLLNPEGRVVRLATIHEASFETAYEPEVCAVIMAGGLGNRLRPLTNDLPKPMLPVGDRPLIERTVEQIKAAGIGNIFIATYYKSDTIKSHFGDGSGLGVNIKYLKEELPLGTAGALRLIQSPPRFMLVINGDVVTTLNLKALFDYHRESGADMTVGFSYHEFQVPFGVLDIQNGTVLAIREKPTTRSPINAGIYALSSSVLEHIPPGCSYNMTDLISTLLGAGRLIAAFPIREYWQDIGEHADYAKAQQTARSGQL